MTWYSYWTSALTGAVVWGPACYFWFRYGRAKGVAETHVKWMESSRQAQDIAMGPCLEVSPTMLGALGPMPIGICRLRSGHLGAHQDGSRAWSLRPEPVGGFSVSQSRAATEKGEQL